MASLTEREREIVLVMDSQKVKHVLNISKQAKKYFGHNGDPIDTAITIFALQRKGLVIHDGDDRYRLHTRWCSMAGGQA